MSVDGTWNVAIDSPMGSQQVTLTLNTDGDKVSGSLGSQMGSVDITDGKVEGDNVNFTAALTEPMPITLEFAATVDGDTISGNASLGTFGSAPFSGTRT